MKYLYCEKCKKKTLHISDFGMRMNPKTHDYTRRKYPRYYCIYCQSWISERDLNKQQAFKKRFG